MLILSFLLLRVGVTPAFEVHTHEEISARAFSQSILGQGYLEGELRLSLRAPLQWGNAILRVQDWLANGSVREDDGLRPRNHFYDPVRDR